MSLILEALRKSEAERRRAQAPDLFAPAQVAVAPARRVPLAWLAGGGTVVLVLVALLLVRAFAPAPAPERPGRAGAVAASDAPAAASRPTTAVPAPATAPTNTAPRLLPAVEEPSAAVVEAPPPGSVPQPGGADGTTAAASEETREPVPAADPPPPAPAAPVASAPQPAPSIDPAAQPLRLSEIAGDARRQLPPLKLTMHMWNEAADRRFVILDGRRLAEGDRIGAVQVAEIRRDGVILDWNGQRLELPLR